MDIPSFAQNSTPSGTDLVGLLADVQQDADAGQGAEERSPAGGDQRQRNPLCGHQSQHHADVEKSLEQDGRRDAEGDEPGKGVLGAEGSAQAAHAQHHEERHNEDGADEPQFLGDVGEDKVGMRLGQKEEFLHALHVAAAGNAAGSYGD